MKKLLAVLLLAVLPACATLNVSQSDDFLRQATVKVTVDSMVCSGVVIEPEIVLTAAHCIPTDPKQLERLAVEGRRVVGHLARPSVDLAVLSVPGMACPCVPVAKAEPAIDTEIKVIGFPVNFAEMLTEGRVQGPLIDPEAPEDFKNVWMVISAPVLYGNSGGPVFALINGQYQVIGIVSALRTVGFGIPISHLGLAVRTSVINEFLHGFSQDSSADRVR